MEEDDQDPSSRGGWTPSRTLNAALRAAAPSGGGFFNNIMRDFTNSGSIAAGPNAAAAGAHGVAGVSANQSSLSFSTGSGNASTSNGLGAILSNARSHRDPSSNRTDQRWVDMPDELLAEIDKWAVEKEAVINTVDTGVPAGRFMQMLKDRMSAVAKLQNFADIDLDEVDVTTLTTLESVQHHISEHGVTDATGFIVCIDPPLLATNYHVFPTKATAHPALNIGVLLDFDSGAHNGPKGMVNSTGFYWSDEKLDVCIVAWQPPAPPGMVGRVPILLRAASQPPGLSNKAADKRLLVIGHPKGLQKHLSLNGGQVVGTYKEFVVYSNDTHGGSSGSPVLNFKGELVALHHTAFKKRKADGSVMFDKAGKPLYKYNGGTDGAAVHLKLLKYAAELPVDHADRALLKVLLLLDPDAKKSERGKALFQQLGW